MALINAIAGNYNLLVLEIANWLSFLFNFNIRTSTYFSSLRRSKIENIYTIDWVIQSSLKSLFFRGKLNLFGISLEKNIEEREEKN
jgi:hypothetical protein